MIWLPVERKLCQYNHCHVVTNNKKMHPQKPYLFFSLLLLKTTAIFLIVNLRQTIYTCILPKQPCNNWA
jgi:hypothetical protein